MWLREGSVGVGANDDEEERRGCLVGLWGLDNREGGWKLWPLVCGRCWAIATAEGCSAETCEGRAVVVAHRGIPWLRRKREQLSGAL